MWIQAEHPVNIEGIKEFSGQVINCLKEAGYPFYVEIITLHPTALMTPDAKILLQSISSEQVFKNRIAVISIIMKDDHFEGHVVKQLQTQLLDKFHGPHLFAQNAKEALSLAIELYNQHKPS